MAEKPFGGAPVKAGHRGPNGYEQINPTTATGLTPPNAGSSLAMIQVEGQPVRYRDDGTAPTADLGNVIAAGDTLVYTGDMETVEFIDTAAGASEVNVLYYF